MEDTLTLIRKEIEGLPLVLEEEVDAFMETIGCLPGTMCGDMYALMKNHDGLGEVLIANFIQKREAIRKGNTEMLSKLLEEERAVLASIA